MKDRTHKVSKLPIRLTSIGPLPPPLGGTTVLFEDYVNRMPALVKKHYLINTTNTRRGMLYIVKEVWIALHVLLAPFRSDVVALHASFNRSLIYGALLKVMSSIARVPVIVRCFGGGHDIQLRDAPVFMRLFETLAFRNRIVLLETKHLCDWARKRHPKSYIDWHPNCREVDENLVANNERSSKFTFLGKVCADKGVDTILRMKERWPSDPFVVEMIGPLDETISKDSLNATEGVTYLGVMSPDEACERLSRAQALVLPTRYLGEGYPGAILEAYAQGTPVIATAWRAIPEIVEEGATGLLVEIDAEDELRQAMLDILKDSQRAAAMRRAALQASKKFSSKEWHGEKWRDWLSLVFRKRAGNGH